MGLGQIDSATFANSVYNSSGLNARKSADADAAKTAKSGRAADTAAAKKASEKYGKTVGDPTLSEAGAKYYEELKSKFSDMEFVLVSQDKVDQAETLAAQFANPNKTIVLIDEDKVEKMAEDKDYRAKYEGIIQNSGAKLDELAASLEKSGLSGNVLGYGMQVKDDGTTSYFAVLKDSSKAQKARIEKKAAESKEAKKVADKKAEKNRQKKRAEEAREDRAKEAEKAAEALAEGKTDSSVNSAKFGRGVTDIDKLKGNNQNLRVIEADSIEALTQKVSEAVISSMSDNILSEQERTVGQNLDIKF
jgi:hypothetical protein